MNAKVNVCGGGGGGGGEGGGVMSVPPSAVRSTSSPL